MKKKYILLMLTLIILLTITILFFAAGVRMHILNPDAKLIAGKISNINNSELTIQGKQEQITVTITPNTTYKKGRKTSQFELKPGQRVLIETTKNNEKAIAKIIHKLA